MDLIHQFNWRYAVKKTGGCITSQKLGLIMDSIRASGSSFGLLPQTVFVIDKPEQLNSIFPPDGQEIKRPTHLIVFSAWTSICHDNINEIIAHTASTNGLSLDHMEDYKTTMKLLLKHPEDFILKWCSKQAYMALGIGLSAAAGQKVDNTPIEVFDHHAIDKILNLKNKGLTSIVLLALGHDDSSVHSDKIDQIKDQTEKQYTYMD